MEVACCIPKEPGFVLRSEVQDDFWPDRAKSEQRRLLTGLIERLQRKGIFVNGHQAQHMGRAVGLGLQVMDVDWPKHQRECEIYWEARHRKREKVSA